MIANQYGIRLDNILKAKDDIAINKLKRGKMEREGKSDEAGIENRKRRLRKQYPNMLEADIESEALNPEEFRHERGRKEKVENQTRTHRNALSRISFSHNKQRETANYKANLTAKSSEEAETFMQTIIKAENPDMPDDQVKAYAKIKTKDYTKVLKHISDAKTTQQVDAITKQVSADGAKLHTISTMKDPMQQQATWSKYRNEKIKSIKDPKLMQEAMTKIPEDYDPQWTAMTIASSSKLIKSAKTMKDYMKKTEAELKAETPGGVNQPTYPQQTAKVNAISKKVNHYFKDIDNPEMALKIKEEVVKRWKKSGMKQNEDGIIKEVIKEMEDADMDLAGDEKTISQKIKNFFGGEDDKPAKKQAKATTFKPQKASAKHKNGTKATTSDGTKVIVKNGQWVEDK